MLAVFEVSKRVPIRVLEGSIGFANRVVVALVVGVTGADCDVFPS